MTKKDFTTTRHCLAGGHCRKCRDLLGGRPFRIDLAGNFALPDGAPDFDCPHGKPWGFLPPARGLGDTVERVIKKVTFGRVKPCGGCRKRRNKLNKMVPYHRGVK